jgi:prepilin-type processing-associated H-X9-DG protein
MSMNTYLGGFAGTTGGWDLSLPWFPRLFFKTTDFTSITPAKLFVFADQRPDVINWSNFMVSMRGFSPSDPAQYEVQEFPGLFHDGGAAFSFADGHGELHRWQDARTMPPLSPNGTELGIGYVASPNNPDAAWLQDHASRPR